MTQKILIRNAHLYATDGDWLPGWLLTEGSAIRLMGPGEPPSFADEKIDLELDAQGMDLLPGFIDLHVHGAIGYEVMDADAERMIAMAQFYARHGVTAFLATTWSAPAQAMRDVLACVKNVVGQVENGATILGVHLEGPYLNPERTGAQDVNVIRRATREEALEFLDSGLVRLITIAPEFPENLWIIDECVKRGIVVSAGHTKAGFAELENAAQHGLRHITHCFNAMVGLGHREIGTVGAAMALPQIHTELIADNIHVHPAVQKILVDVKTPGRVILVTDAIRGTGMNDGEYQIDHRTITIKNGEVRLPDGTIAGSVLTMERALRNVMKATGRPLSECWVMSSLNAAREIGISNRKGSLEVGKDADLVLLDEAGQVKLTVAEGRVTYRDM
ncbi:MAG TPA: N-acetylglucosamine-6-phosphate deacetylase [Anaerolineaceae bacterium]|nr:N-acetylglucosamine-6-phosphate deacetylase [Anaerolineaceae bacterium]